MASELHVSLDVPLPAELEVGGGTAVFVAGTCYCPTAEIVALSLCVGDRAEPVTAFGMPRLDFFAELHPDLDPFATDGLARDPGAPADPQLRAYRSGFWGVATVPADAGVTPEIRIGVRARLADGTVLEAPLASPRRVDAAGGESPVPDPPGHGPGLVAIAMATHDPPPQLFAAQIDSIRAQTHRDWICVISDDRSGPEGVETIARTVAGDPRFVVSTAPRRLGFAHNFARAMALAPPAARWIALCDQDDRWHPDKLATLIEAIGDHPLVYSDARVIARDGTLIAGGYWETRHNNHSDPLSLLVANAVTGAASLIRADLRDVALPLPPPQFAHFHDHWLALCATAVGEIVYVDRPLYDYVQHRGASLGHATATRRVGLRARLTRRRGLRERVGLWRLHHFVDVARLQTLCAILELRLGGRMRRRARRRLRAFTAADRSLVALVALAVRGLADLAGDRTETLGAEWMLACALAWRRLLAASARERPTRRLRLDAVPPPSLALAPTRVWAGGPADELAAKVAPLDLAISPGAPVRVNLLIPTFDLRHFFGGYIAKLNLARALARRGVRVRLVTVDPVGALPPDWRRRIEAYAGLAGLFDEVEVAFGRGPSPLEVSPRDRFVATTWWTAHIADAAARTLGRPGVVYLIQEYEPFTFPAGAWAALARESYGLEHRAVFSTELLRDWFARQRIGVYADAAGPGGAGPDDGGRGGPRAIAFENAITDVIAPTPAELAGRDHRRLLFYARPEPHAARNMYELGVLALARAAERGVLDGWELRAIGTVNEARRVELGGGVALELLPRADQAAYAALLREHDVGLALMDTPHPSLVPIEMAAGGLVTVTSRYENKTPEAMAAISPNIIAAPPSVTGLVDALAHAVAASGDHAARVAGSAVAWSRNWETSFDGPRLDAILAWLDLA